jgi:hypothetical protein
MPGTLPSQWAQEDPAMIATLDELIDEQQERQANG